MSDLHLWLFAHYNTAESSIYLQSVSRKEVSNGDYQHKNYLLNRLSDIVESLYLFAELGQTHLHHKFGDSRKDEVLKVINHLLKDPLIQSYFKKRDRLQRHDISLMLMNHPDLDTIIFHEIEYMNFGRMSFIHWLKEKGFRIEFHVPYNPNLPEVHKYWNSVYSVISNIGLDEVSNNHETIELAGSKFAHFYESKSSRDLCDDIRLKIMEFQTPHDFAKYQQTNPDAFLAVEPETVRRVVDQHKSLAFESPVGKFIYHLQFCTLENDELNLNYETYVELLTSGIIDSGAASGSGALGLLLDLDDYFSGVESMGEIKDRIEALAELELITRTIDKVNSEDAGRNRFKRYMLNPFRSFSYLNQDRYQVTIHQLMDLTDKLEKTLRYLLLEENAVIDVNDYFAKWKKFIEYESVESNDQRLWLDIFSETYPEHWEFSMQELLQLIYLEAAARVKENEKIKSVASVQEIILGENHRHLHLTNLTQMNFPERHHAKLSEFFTYTDVKECVQSHPVQQSKYLYYLLVDYTVSHSFHDLGVYRIYQILSQFHGDITFSWIKNLEEDSFRNVFLDILADLYTDGKIINYTAKQDEVELDVVTEKQIESTVKENLEGKIPNLYWLDHDFCSKKFFLTAIIEQQPIYESDFHHRLLFSKIGKLFSYSKKERDKLRKYIYPLFPQWTYTLKENLIDTEYKTELRQYKTFENISYPKELRSLQILRSVYRENRRRKARNQYRREKTFNNRELLKQFAENVKTHHVVAEPGNHCKMCPHLTSCLEGMYAIDNAKK